MKLNVLFSFPSLSIFIIIVISTMCNEFNI